MTSTTMMAIALAMFAGVIVCMEAGRRIAVWRRASGRAAEGTAALAGTLFALLGLLIAFTFSGAASRFDDRRDLVVQEANAIGTAWLRLDVLPPDAQPSLRDLFRRYLDLRIAVYARLPDLEAAMAELGRANELQGQIWSAAVRACQAASSPAVTTLILTSLNEMIDLTTTRTMAARLHPPALIYWMLFLLLLVCSLFIGYEQADRPTRPLLHTIVYAVIMTIAIFVILNLEYPRLGLIGLDATDQVLVDLRKTMG